MVKRSVLFLLLVALAVPCAWADEEVGDRLEEAKSRLREAFATDDDEVIEEAIEYAAGLDDAEVIKEIARGVRTKNVAVIQASLKALGRTPSEKALEELHRIYRRAKKARLDGHEYLFANLLKEIGRHGNAKSVEILRDSPFTHLTTEVGRARLLGLGNIRTPASVKALIELSRMAGGRGARTRALSNDRGRLRPEFRTALVVLTGHDAGMIPADWDTWYRQNKKDLLIAGDRPKVPEAVSRMWEAYWGKPYYAEGDEPAPPTLRSPIQVVAEPSPDEVASAVEALKGALKSKSEPVIIDTLQEWGGVLDRKVVHEVARAARYRSHNVQMVAIDVLGWTRYDKALKQLHRLFQRRKKLHKEDPALFAQLLKAVGRHRDPSSIRVLTKSPFKGITLASGRARIFGLGMIRDRKSLEELIAGTQLAGGSTPRSWRPAGEKRFTDEFAVALTILTGQEFGRRLESWREWWRDHRKTFKVDPARPSIPAAMQRAWEEYWNEPYYE